MKKKSLEERASPASQELERKARSYRRLGLGSILIGGLMLVPIALSKPLGYDMKTLDTLYECFAGLLGFCSLAPVTYGMVTYMFSEMLAYEEKKR
ncbi:hypothetical protein KY336_03890 [Candidatus Woesearchaeota archaeon]|nr:hypothetical protein [Candidatus Woesearchaeota archaeon]